MRTTVVVSATALVLVAGCANSGGAQTPATSVPAPVHVTGSQHPADTTTERTSRSRRVVAPFATMIRRHAPRTTAIAGVVDLYGDGETVLAATSQGISRSVDGGRRWSTVLAGYRMASVSHGPTGYFAIGGTRNDRHHITATSPDGITWSVVVDHESVPNATFSDAFGSVATMDGAVGLEVVAPTRLLGAGPMDRTNDGGRHWRPVSQISEAQGGLQQLSDGVIVTTARGTGRDCFGAVWQSDDLGATWHELPGSCSPLQLTGVDFTSPTDAVAVGGQEWKAGGGQLIETTDDGGVSWTRTHYIPNCQAVRCQDSTPDGLGGVDFLSATSGFVLEGECVDSLPGPCGGQLLWTTDGGRTLTRLASPPGDGWLSVAVTSPGHYVGAASAPDGEKSFSAVGLTTDAGHHWTYEAPPNDFHTDYGDPLSGAGSHLLWITPVGTLGSTDGGHRWALVSDPRPARHRLRAYRLRIGAHDSGHTTSDGPAHWELQNLGLSPHAWVVYQPKPGLPGHRYRMPDWIGWVEALVATGPRSAVFAGLDGNLWRSTDGGATWRESWPMLPGEGR